MDLKALLIIFIGLVSYNMNSYATNKVLVIEKDSKEALIGVVLKSLSSQNQICNSDLDGYLKLENSKKSQNEVLEIEYTGFKSIVISRQELLNLDTIFLELKNQNQTLGTTGVLPYMQISFYVDKMTENGNSRKENKQKREFRENEVKKLVEKVNSYYKEEFGKLVFTFEVDVHGNISSFELLEFSYQSRTHYVELKTKLKTEVIDENVQLGELEYPNSTKGRLETIKYTLPMKVD